MPETRGPGVTGRTCDYCGRPGARFIGGDDMPGAWLCVACLDNGVEPIAARIMPRAIRLRTAPMLAALLAADGTLPRILLRSDWQGPTPLQGNAGTCWLCDRIGTHVVLAPIPDKETGEPFIATLACADCAESYAAGYRITGEPGEGPRQ